MSKVLGENKLTVMMERLLWEFNLYWKFLNKDETIAKNKKRFHSSYSLFNY